MATPERSIVWRDIKTNKSTVVLQAIEHKEKPINQTIFLLSELEIMVSICIIFTLNFIGDNEGGQADLKFVTSQYKKCPIVCFLNLRVFLK